MRDDKLGTIRRKMPASLDVLLSEPIGVINPNIYGHFMEHLGACIYEGVWNEGGLCGDVIDALGPLRPPVVRWPGGCFADDYHWQDGIGPRERRPRRGNLHGGGVVESNQFGTHEFISFCRAVGAQPYVSGNVGSGSPREMRDWVEYCNHPGGSTLADLRRSNGAQRPLNGPFWGRAMGLSCRLMWSFGGWEMRRGDAAGILRRKITLKSIGGLRLICADLV